MLGYESLSSYSNISHFVTARQGGCSEGAYASFNCTPYSGDEAEKESKSADGRYVANAQRTGYSFADS